jgi:vacuole morphology and inheritance protein 14
LDCLGSDDQGLTDASLRVNNLLKDKLMVIVKIEKEQGSSATFNKVFEILQDKISTQDTNIKNGEGVNKTSDEAMQWIAHLIDNISTEVDSLPSKIIPNLKSDNLRIVESAVKLISKIINKVNTYEMVGTILSELQGKSYDQSKYLTVLKTLFTHVNPERLINHLAKVLQGLNPSDIRVYVTQNLDILLNIEEGLSGLRAKIQNPESVLFSSLFEIWASDPISCVSLSLLAGRYQLASQLVLLMSLTNMKVGMLVRLAQIAKLLDMPHYARLRMQLLQPQKYPHLILAIKGIIMLLPQGKAHDSLRSRLECSSLHHPTIDTATQTPASVGTVSPQKEEEPEKYLHMVVEQNLGLFNGLDKQQVLAQLN